MRRHRLGVVSSTRPGHQPQRQVDEHPDDPRPHAECDEGGPHEGVTDTKGVAQAPGNTGDDPIAAATSETELPDLSHDEMIAATTGTSIRDIPENPRGFVSGSSPIEDTAAGTVESGYGTDQYN